jgi:hypothetical protein
MDPMQSRLRISVIILLVVIVLGVLGFVVTEDLSLADALYFTIVTVATVGYGDIHPLTQTGKVLSIILIIAGVGAFLGVIANTTEVILNKRERKNRREKLNLIINVFLTEVGIKLLSLLSSYDPEIDAIRNSLIVTEKWSDQDFNRLKLKFENLKFTIDKEKINLNELRDFLKQKSEILLRLLENPSVLEHENFSNLLRSILHLREELLLRNDVSRLPDTDKSHLAKDAERAYNLIVVQWIEYAKYLKKNYPYLFSLIIRTNPFDENASPIIKK